MMAPIQSILSVHSAYMRLPVSVLKGQINTMFLVPFEYFNVFFDFP